MILQKAMVVWVSPTLRELELIWSRLLHRTTLRSVDAANYSRYVQRASRRDSFQLQAIQEVEHHGLLYVNNDYCTYCR